MSYSYPSASAARVRRLHSSSAAPPPITAASISQTNIGGPPFAGADAGDPTAGVSPGWGWGWGSGDDVAGGKASDCVEDAGAASGALDCAAGADPPAEGEDDCGLVCTLRTGPDSAGGAVTVR